MASPAVRQPPSTASGEMPPGARAPRPARHDPVAEGLSPQRAFLLLRYTLIIATAYLLLVEESLQLPPVAALLLIAAALASNVLLPLLPLRATASPWFGPAIIAIDTLWITAALLISGRFNAEFYFLYFFILLLAAIGETLWLIALAAVAVCTAYVYVLAASGGDWSWWTSPSLIRIPFLFTAAAFYGYLVDRTRQERHRAEEADRIKTEFVGTISHELRTPLTVILGYVDLLLDGEFGPVPEEQRAVLGKVQAAGDNLHRYLTRLLDISRLVNRLQSGREAIMCSEFSLSALFSELRHDFPDADAGGTVRWPNAEHLPVLYTDREKLLTILRNLVENAEKYGAGKPVLVEVTTERGGDEIRISVRDHGMGIAAPDLAHVFAPFRRTPDAVATNAQGVGLGLYIVRQFAELLRGSVQVESTRGVGTTFTVRVPRQLRRPADGGA